MELARNVKKQPVALAEFGTENPADLQLAPAAVIVGDEDGVAEEAGTEHFAAAPVGPEEYLESAVVDAEEAGACLAFASAAEEVEGSVLAVVDAGMSQPGLADAIADAEDETVGLAFEPVIAAEGVPYQASASEGLAREAGPLAETAAVELGLVAQEEPRQISQPTLQVEERGVIRRSRQWELK